MLRQFLMFFLVLRIIFVGTEVRATASMGTEGVANFFIPPTARGKIEPCHCIDNQSGGLGRFSVNFLEKERADVPSFWGDSGDTFFSMPHLNPTMGTEELLRAKAMAKAFRWMKLDAFGPGERDMAGGIDNLLDLQRLSGAVFVTSNLIDRQGMPLFEPYHIFQVGKRKIGVLGLFDDQINVKDWGVQVRPPAEALKDWLPKLKGTEVVVVLSHLGLSRDRELAGLAKGLSPNLDLIFGSHSMDVLNIPLSEAGVRIVQTDIQGKDVGMWSWIPGHPEISSYKLVQLDSTYIGKNRVNGISQALKEQIHNLALRPPNPSQESGGRYVANPYRCRTCHREQYDFWAGTKHAAAYLVLYAKNEHFDPECIGCHSLGFGEASGFTRIAEPLELKKSRSLPHCPSSKPS